MPTQPDRCPFDHPIRRGNKVESLDGHFHVICRDCGATGPDRRSVADALNAWNRRRSHDGDGA